MLEELKKQVWEANISLPEHRLVTFTWGNVSGIDRESGLIVIKPSGVAYEALRPEDLVVLDLEGKVIEGKLNPSSDTPTHIEIYKAFPEVGGVIHTHSSWATSWAQACRGIPAYGTTHADYFYGEIPCTRPLTEAEVSGEYEKATGEVIVGTFRAQKIDPVAMPGVLVSRHGPFAWGESPSMAVHNAVVIERAAEMAFRAEHLTPKIEPVEQYLLDKHYSRKHGPNAYYGQKK